MLDDERMAEKLSRVCWMVPFVPMNWVDTVLLNQDGNLGCGWERPLSEKKLIFPIRKQNWRIEFELTRESETEVEPAFSHTALNIIGTFHFLYWPLFRKKKKRFPKFSFSGSLWKRKYENKCSTSIVTQCDQSLSAMKKLKFIMQTNMEQVEKWSLFPVTTDSQNRV